METETYEYSTSIFFWIKGIIEITQRDIMICYPNTFLWVFPDGRSKDIVPLRNISGVSIERYTNYFWLLLGVTLDFLGVLVLGIIVKVLFSIGSFFSMLGGIMSLLLIALFSFIPGTLMILSSMRKTLVIFCSGDEFDIDVPFFESNKIFDIQDCINDALDYEADKYDMNLRKRELAEEIGDAVGRAIDKRK